MPLCTIGTPELLAEPLQHETAAPHAHASTALGRAVVANVLHHDKVHGFTHETAALLNCLLPRLNCFHGSAALRLNLLRVIHTVPRDSDT
jgi:hypothetical protein